MRAIATIGLVVGLLAAPAAAAPATRVQADPPSIAAADDFSGNERGYFWDFNSKDHLAWEDSITGWDNGRLLNGWFVGRTAEDDRKPGTTLAQIRFSPLSLPGTIPTQTEHPRTPLDPSYDILRVSMCSSRATKARVFWHRDASFADGDFGSTNLVNISRGCRIYKFDLADRNPNVGTLKYSDGNMQSLRLFPSNDPGTKIKIDWATLTPTTRGPTVELTWDDNGDPVNLYLSSRADGRRKALIAASLKGGSYEWATPNLAPGTYWIVIKERGAKRVEGTFHVNAPPQGKVTAPSFTSGPDYATQVRKDPWDMSQKTDVARTINLRIEAFAQGKFEGENVAGSGDPGVFLAFKEPIDPAKWYYLTYRMKTENSNEARDGSVVRLLWWTNAQTNSTTQDIRDFDLWQVVTVDLRTATLEPNVSNDAGMWGADRVTKLRVDPHESKTPAAFFIDYVLLTRNDSADRVYTVRWTSEDEDGDAVTGTVYYDDDRTFAGSSRIACGAGSGDGKCVWTTAGVPEGEYHVFVVLDDGTETTTIVSEAPVEISH